MKKQPTTIDVLRRMKSLLRKGWTRHVTARGKSGKQVSAKSRYAVKFCLIGAEIRSARGTNVDVIPLIKRCIKKHEGRRVGIAEFNDARDRKKGEVLAIVDCAIKEAEAAQ